VLTGTRRVLRAPDATGTRSDASTRAMKTAALPWVVWLGLGLLYLMTACSSSTCPSRRVGGTGACIADESASMQNAATARDDAGEGEGEEDAG
jgi:hypothetical protein